MWIIKLGGSLLGTPELKSWLRLIAHQGDGQIIIVPGGGIFADAVRLAEQRVSLSDHAAHALAVYAMDQYARLLVDLEPKLVLASNELELAECSWQHRGIVWQPSPMVLADASIPTSWQVTSDSLAAWLANKCEANHLVLIKSAEMSSDIGDGSVSVEALVTQGVVDAALPRFMSLGAFTPWIAHHSAHQIFAQGFSKVALTRIARRLR